MYHVVVVKDEGIELEKFDFLESAIATADANTEDSEVIRIGIFKYGEEIAEWFPTANERKATWYYRSYIWREGHPSALLSKDYTILRGKGTPTIEDCEVDCVGKR